MSVLKKVGKFFLTLIFIIAAVTVALFALYAFTRKNADEYLDSSFMFYANVDSVRDIYETGLDLSALQTVLEQSELTAFKTAFDAFKSGDFARNPFFHYLLNIKTAMQIYGDNSFVIALDMGLLSTITRFVPLVNYFLSVDGVDISTIRRGKSTYYELLLTNGATYYFSIRNNLLFFSQTNERLEIVDTTYGSNRALKFNTEVDALKKDLSGRAHIRFYADTGYFQKTIPLLRDENVQKIIALGKIAGGSLHLSEESVDLKLTVSISSQSAQLNNFLRYDPPGLVVPSWMPAGATLASSIKIESIRSLYDAGMLFQSEINRQNIAKSLKMLSAFSLTFDEAVSWIGSEVGVFYIGGSVEPVIFLKIGDARAKSSFLKKLTDSIVFKKDDSLVLDSQLIRRIVLPDFFKFLFSSFLNDVNLAQPYYIEENGYLFFSPNAENLLTISAAKRENNYLALDSDFDAVKKISTHNSPKNPDVLAYYNIRKKLPAFIDENSLVGRLLKLYGNGLASLYFSEKNLVFNLALQGAVKSSVEPVIGYPKELGKNIASVSLDRDIYIGELKGSLHTGFRAIFVDDNGILRITDLAGSVLRSYEVGKGSRAAVYTGKKSWITVFARDGTLFVFDGDLQLLNGYPLLLPSCRNSFFPVFAAGRLWLYDAQQASLCALSIENPQVKLFPYRFEFEIAQQPFFSAPYIVCAPRNLFGEVFLFKDDGPLVSGWPIEVGGNFLSGPQIVGGTNPFVLFLTQNGILNLWNTDGSSRAGFPMECNANFYSAPIVFNYEKERKAIFLVDSAGLARVVSFEGLILAESKLDVSGGRDLKLTVCDIDGNGSDEIFLYGASDRLAAFSAALVPLAGFPVTGNTKPYFIDADKDGKTELFTVSVDGKLNAYRLHNSKGR